MPEILRKFSKNVIVYGDRGNIGQFDELYFAPTQVEDIACALDIYKRQGVFPVVMLRIIEINKENIHNLCNLINEIQDYNKLNGYEKKINIKFKAKNGKDLDCITQVIGEVAACRVSVILEYCAEKSIYKISDNSKVDFVRVNYNLHTPKIKKIEGEKIYFLARFELSNQMDIEKIVREIKNIGFNGVQFVKGHRSNQGERLNAEIKSQLLKVKETEEKLDVFLERNLELLNQPLFKMRETDYGKCFSSMLILTIEGDKITNCPFNKKANIESDDINYVLKSRRPIDSKKKGCYDCGFISDNNLYRKIYENNIIFWGK